MTEEEQKNEFLSLDTEYQEYIKRLKVEWHQQNPFHSRNVIEVWSNHEREQADQHIARWKCYVTPLAETWWKERGWGIIWPDNDAESTKVFKLEKVPLE